MKKSLRKIMAGVSAAAMLATAMPVVNAFAADEAEANISYREVAEGAIITDYVCDADELVIPAEINGLTVVGIDNFAFGLVSKEVNIVVPATVTYFENHSFMTAEIINNQLVAFSGATTVNGVVKYWINDVVGMNYTDAQISDAVERAIAHVGEVNIANMTLEEGAITIIREILDGNCGFSADNIARLEKVLKSFAYNEVTLEGPADTAAQAYADTKWNLVYNVTSEDDVLLGDATLDGKINLYDAIEIAKYMMGEELSDEQLVAADITEDGKVNLYDAIAVCEIIMG